MSKQRLGLGVFAAISALSASALAHAQGGPAPPANQRSTIVANYREADVRAVIEQLALATQTNVVIDDDVQGKITFYRETPLSADEYRAAVIAQLIAAGYAVTERGGVLYVGPRMP